MTPLVFVNRLPGCEVPASDRGLQYGDGLFETLRIRNHRALLWNWHWRRVQKGVDVLGLRGMPDSFDLETFLLGQASQISSDDVLAKVQFTRSGSGGRGYRPDPGDSVREVISLMPYVPPIINPKGAVSLCLLDKRLWPEPDLAGIKHLNRLPQVLASRELDRQDAFDGVLLDCDGYVIETTRANLFFFDGQAWTTPGLRHSGVEGTLRAVLLDGVSGELVPAVHEKDWLWQDISQVKAAAIGNSVSGLLPIGQIGALPLDANISRCALCEPVNRALGYVDG